MSPSSGPREVPTRYLTRVWPAGEPPPPLTPSEIWSPDSRREGEIANDRAITRAIRAWAQQRADSEDRSYAYEVHGYVTMGDRDAGHRIGDVVVLPIASGTVRPAGQTGPAAPPAGLDDGAS